MEHRSDTRAVLARYLRRRWKIPIHVAAVTMVMALVIGVGTRHVEVVEAQSARASHEVLEGVVESLRSRGVGSPYAGQVVKLAVRPGQPVKRGDLLFKMDERPVRHALAEARARRAEALQELRSAEAQRAQELADERRTIATLAARVAEERRLALLQAEQGQAESAAEGAYFGEERPDGVVYTDEYPSVRISATEFYDPAGLDGLLAQLAMARESLQERTAAWEPYLSAARRQYADAEAQVKRLSTMLAGAVRLSPMDGVVTAVYAGVGRHVSQGIPVVRVDDPAGYRVVTVVSEEIREHLQPGAALTVAHTSGSESGRLVKIVSGWDRDLFQYYLWLKPADPRALQPGQKVQVRIPESRVYASNEL